MADTFKDLINSIPKIENDQSSADFITDPDYSDSSEDIIKEALNKGFDVIHMENGDIITTGTRLVVTQYRWDPEKKKMMKILSKQKSE